MQTETQRERLLRYPAVALRVLVVDAVAAEVRLRPPAGHMVLLGHRDAEYGHEAISRDMLECTPITLDLPASKSVQRPHSSCRASRPGRLASPGACPKAPQKIVTSLRSPGGVSDAGVIWWPSACRVSPTAMEDSADPDRADSR